MPEKKNTATREKEWVSAFSIFSREKKYDTFASIEYISEQYYIQHHDIPFPFMMLKDIVSWRDEPSIVWRLNA